jgi:hypothetical protein
MNDIIEFEFEGTRIRTTSLAISRATAAKLEWSKLLGRSNVATVAGRVVATIRIYVNRGSLLHIQGFTFWGMNRVLGREHWSTVRRFDYVADARKFAQGVVKTASEALRDAPQAGEAR